VPNVQSSRDVIIRTDAWPEAVRFYAQVLGFTASSRSEGLVGFETRLLQRRPQAVRRA